ncbi:DUF4926 domain-containing protein [Clostridium manihotivorum]|uniref:DUF4926 domain-containing protein n=1 Tax=Clostridium manihotivorum TaxID=2320868 RepID=A0A410DX38_9CLOT|nr:DUF4926 domain-containing protein [Clostridium manihotivorum]QAA33813.1 DUF4926 domain-containing protein [Clostridium manihotivorum]
MKFAEYDTVILLKDYESEGLKKGDIGAMIMIYTEPNEAYEVEFVDNDGEVKAQIVLLPHEIGRYSK